MPVTLYSALKITSCGLLQQESKYTMLPIKIAHTVVCVYSFTALLCTFISHYSNEVNFILMGKFAMYMLFATKTADEIAIVEQSHCL